jgi:programmed cell death protein 5
MDEEEIKKIRERKKKELQEGSPEQQEERQEMEEEMERRKKQALRKILTKDAIERLGRVRLANEDLANQLETYLVRLSDSGQVKNKITEDKLKQILKSIKDEQKQDWNIKRR